jgi:Fe-S cluster assembly protein SufD
MAIESFLKADAADPDWVYSPNQYFGKQFKIIDANCLMIQEGTDDRMILRLNPTEPDLLCKSLQIVSKEASNLSLYMMCEGEESTQQVFLYTVTAEANSMLNIGLFVKNGLLNKHIIECEVHEGAVVNIIGIVENSEGGSSEIITKVLHAGHNAESNQIVNCVSGKDSRTVFQGSVKVPEEAENNACKISNYNLITEKGGQCFTIPQMYIDSGKTESAQVCESGEFDQEQLWYLTSRGLSFDEAKKILLQSHQDTILDIIQDDEVRDELKEFFRD